MTDRKHAPRRTPAALALLCTALACAVGADDELIDGSRTVCTHPEAALPRIVQVVYESPDTPIPCKVLYEKEGAVEELGAARNTTGHCEKIERKVVGNLARGGYECRHSFLGALAEADRSVALDLFAGDGSRSTAERTVTNAGSAVAGVRGDAEAGLDREPTAPPVLDPADLAHVHTYTHSHPIGDEDGEPIEHTHTTTAEPVASTIVDAGAPRPEMRAGSTPSGAGQDDSSTSGVVAVDGTPGDTSVTSAGTSAGRHAILSQALPAQSAAHRFSAELRRSFPNVETRVVRRAGAGGGWHVALGVGDDGAALEQALVPLGAEVATLFDVVALEAAKDVDEPLVFAQDDWARYAVASCWADGRRTSVELAECADVVIDVDAFVDCLGGGICAPERFREGMDDTAIDFASVLGADDPIAEARDRVTRRMEGCEQLSDVTEAEFAECATLSVLDEDHREVYDCYQRSASDIAVLECAGSDTVADYAQAWERCGTSGYEATTCLLESSDNDYLESAAYCAAYEDTTDITTCALDANLSDDDALVLACVTDHVESSERAACLARERLSDTEYASVECAGHASSVSEYGLCVGERSGSLSAETLHAARCLDGAEITSRTLLDCSGGQFVGEDIGDCVEFGLEDPRCFEPETVIAQVAHDTVEDYLQLASLDNEIARFRQELYALDGGDLAQMLANDAGAGLATTEKKVRRGLGEMFGFGK